MIPKDTVILFADDDADDRFFLVQAFKELGIDDRLKIVEDGQEVIDYLDAAGGPGADGPHPALAILDLSMPRKSGFDALQWIRGSERWAGLPVIILSASAQPQDVKRAYRLGASAYVMKPSSPAELIELAGAITAFWLRFAEL